MGDFRLANLPRKVTCGVSKLGKDKHLVFGMRLGNVLAQSKQLLVVRRVPLALGAEKLPERLRVLSQVICQ